MNILSGFFDSWKPVSNLAGTDVGSTAAENDAAAVSPPRSQLSMSQPQPPHCPNTPSSPTSQPPTTSPIPRSSPHPSNPRKRAPAAESDPQSKRHKQRVPISEAERRLCGELKNPPDAVAAPNPMSHFYAQTTPGMKNKPGSDRSYKPVNTLKDSQSHQTQRPRLVHTYGSQSRTSRPQPVQGFLGFLEEQPETFSALPRRQRQVSISPSKRRKTHHIPSSETQVIAVDDDDDDLMEISKPVNRSENSSPTCPPSVSSRSHASNDSGSRRQKKDLLSRSEYAQVEDQCNPRSHRRPTSRHRNANSTQFGSSNKHHGQEGSLPVVADMRKQHSSRAESLEINYGFTPKHEQSNYLVPKDEYSEDELQTGEGPVQSRHFQPQVNGSARVNPSTSVRNDVEPVSRRKATRLAGNLRDRFARINSDMIEDEDELINGDDPRLRTGQNKSLVQPSRSKKNVITGSPRWSLEYARTQDYERQAPGLHLRPSLDTNVQGFDIIHQVEGSSYTKDCTINTRKILHCLNDDLSRMRLTGSKDNDGNIYWYDLKFSHQKELRSFRDKLQETGLIRKCSVSDEQYMIKLLANPLQPNRRGSSSIPTNDPALDSMVARSRMNQQQLVPSSRQRVIDQLKPDHTASSVPQELVNQTGLSVTTGQENILQSPRPTRTTRSAKTIHNLDTEDSQSRARDPKVYKFSETEGLGAPWPRPVQYGEGRRRALVEFDDLIKLDDDEMLNDALVDFYLIYLFNQAKVPERTVYFFNTHFFTSLTRSTAGQKGDINYSNVSKWVKEDIFAYDYVVVPVCENLHWYLAIICNVSEIGRKYAGQDSPSSVVEENPEKTLETPAAYGSVPPPFKEYLGVGRALASDVSDQNLLDLDANKKLASKKLSQGVGDPLGSSEPRASHTREASLEETRRLQRLSIDESADYGNPAPGNGEPTTDGKSVVNIDKPEPDNKIGSSIVDNEVLAPVPERKKTKRRQVLLRKYPVNEPIILILDSMGQTHPRACKVLKEYIAQEALQKRSMDAQITQKPFYVKETHIPMQNNFTDCGVYLLGYWQKFISNPREFVNRILSREMDPKTDWPDMTTNKIRGDIRTALRGLAAEQEKARKAMRATKKSKQASPLPAKVKELIEHPKPKPNFLASTETEPSKPDSSLSMQKTSVGRETRASDVQSPDVSKRRCSPQVVIYAGSSSEQPHKQSIALVDPKEAVANTFTNANQSAMKKRAREEELASEKQDLPQVQESKLQQSEELPSTVHASRPSSRDAAPAADLRGSSQAPINLDDSQGTVVVNGSPRQTRRSELRSQPSIEEISVFSARGYERNKSSKGLNGASHAVVRDTRSTSSQVEGRVDDELPKQLEGNTNTVASNRVSPSGLTIWEDVDSKRNDLIGTQVTTQDEVEEDEEPEAEVSETPEPPEAHERD